MSHTAAENHITSHYQKDHWLRLQNAQHSHYHKHQRLKSQNAQHFTLSQRPIADITKDTAFQYNLLFSHDHTDHDSDRVEIKQPSELSQSD